MATIQIQIKGCLICDHEKITSGDSLKIKIKQEYVDSGFPEQIIGLVESIVDATAGGVYGQILTVSYDETLLPTILNICHFDGTPTCYGCCDKNSDAIAELRAKVDSDTVTLITQNGDGVWEVTVDGVITETITDTTIADTDTNASIVTNPNGTVTITNAIGQSWTSSLDTNTFATFDALTQTITFADGQTKQLTDCCVTDFQYKTTGGVGGTPVYEITVTETTTGATSVITAIAGVSSDASNSITLGTDGLPFYNDDDIVAPPETFTSFTITDEDGATETVNVADSDILLHRSLNVGDKHTNSTGLGDISVSAMDSNHSASGGVVNVTNDHDAANIASQVSTVTGNNSVNLAGRYNTTSGNFSLTYGNLDVNTPSTFTNVHPELGRSLFKED